MKVLGAVDGYRDIDMDEEDNNVQQYIIAYQNTLNNVFHASNVSTRISYISDMIEVTSTFYDSTINRRANPGAAGDFWLGTHAGRRDSVFYVANNGSIYGSSSDDMRFYGKLGVRPLIIITY